MFIGVCLLVSAVLLPTAAHLPHWVEFELVLGIWWIVWFVLLSWMLFQGQVVEDDFQLSDMQGATSGTTDGCAPFLVDPTGCIAAEGCLGPIVGILALIAAFLLITAFIEFVVPAVAIVLYFAIRGMIARVINDNHHCAGETWLSLLWGIIWATAYTAPIAAFVYAIHWWVLHKGA